MGSYCNERIVKTICTMKKDINFDLIERYLDGALSAVEQQEVESRIATDPEFRAELELRRALQQHLGDPGEFRLRSALDEILNPALPGDTPLSEPPDARPKSRGWPAWAGLVVFLAIVGIISWYWWNGRNSTPAGVPVLEKPEDGAPALPQENKPVPLPPAPTQNPAKKDWSKQPIAMANPADFTPNPALDARIGGVRGDDGADLELVSPASESAFLLHDGRIALTVRGTINIDTIPADQPFRLFIYSNRPKDWENKQALFERTFPLKPVGTAQYEVDFRQQLSLRPGLYYMLVGQQRAPGAGTGYRTLWVGKFMVKVKM